MNQLFIKSQKYRHLATIGYSGLFVTLLIWKVILDENPIAILWLIPLIFPAAGIAKKRPYTFAWTGFISAGYVTHAVTMLFTSDSVYELRFALFEALFAFAFFFGAVYYIKYLHLYRKQTEQEAASD